MSCLNSVHQVLSPHWSTQDDIFSPFSQMWLSLRSQCAWEQCCDQKQHTGSLQCWPVWVAVQHGRAGKQRQDEPSLAEVCTLSPAGRPLLSGVPRNQKPRQPSEDGSAPDIQIHNGYFNYDPPPKKNTQFNSISAFKLELFSFQLNLPYRRFESYQAVSSHSSGSSAHQSANESTNYLT